MKADDSLELKRVSEEGFIIEARCQIHSHKMTIHVQLKAMKDFLSYQPPLGINQE